MKIIPCLLGDRHNFGRVVSHTKYDIVYKPRSVIWESMLLSQSLYRSEIDRLFNANQLTSPFSLAPILDYNCNIDFPFDGSTSFLKISSATNYDKNLATAAGATAALCVYLGISDLHSENLFFGKNLKTKTIFFPIDIECILNLTHLPSQVHLIPKITDPSGMKQPGLLELFNHILTSNPTEIFDFLLSYHRSLFLLAKSAGTITKDCLSSVVSSKNAPIRVVIRQTQDYADLLDQKQISIIKPIIPEEIEQLNRDEIPYFFTFSGSSKLFYFINDKWDYKEVHCKKPYWDEFSIAPLINLNSKSPFEHFSGALLDKALKNGLAQLVSYFVGLYAGEHVTLKSKESYLFTQDQNIHLNLANLLKLKWKKSF